MGPFVVLFEACALYEKGPARAILYYNGSDTLKR